MLRTILISLMLMFSILSPYASAQNQTDNNPMWHYINDQGELKVKLYFLVRNLPPLCRSPPVH